MEGAMKRAAGSGAAPGRRERGRRSSAGRWCGALLLLLGGAAGARGQAAPGLAPEGGAPVDGAAGNGAALSPRNASYTIDVRLDHASRTLRGSQTLTWTNLQEQPTNQLWFHLYWNAWSNRQSTWMREDRLRGRSDRRGEIAADDWSYLEVDSVALAGGADLTRTMYFAFPDDRNGDDRTVMVVLLPAAVGPGETVRLDMAWHAKIPRTFARTGFRGDSYFFAHWFPKLGVYEPAGWNCHEFHAGTEFYSDYGVYDVSMTVPEEFVVGATGREVERRANSDGTATHRYVQEDVHEFAWTASPDYVVVEDRFEHASLPAVDIRLLTRPEHRHQVARHFAATKAALESYGTWYGPYPYGHVTVVDPPFGAGFGGMEYPTLFTAGTRRFNPPGGGNPEGVTIHEAGHQFWYGIVGNNEFEFAWLDEGLNTFSTGRTEYATFGEPLYTQRFFQPPGTDTSGFFALLLAGFDYGGVPHRERLGRYRVDATSDPQSTPSFEYHPGTEGSLSYSKTALWLATLENWLGWDALQAILSTFFERWRFAHPTPEDFLAIANEVTEADVGSFLRSVMTSDTFDYAVDSVATFPVPTEGWVRKGDELVYVPPRDEPAGDGETEYRSEVVVRRHGGATFPMEVLFVFEDGHEIRRRWPGAARWRLLTEDYPAKLDYAVIDPDVVLALDLYPSNNSLEADPEPGLPAWKWAARWTVWLEDFLSTFAFFV